MKKEEKDTSEEFIAWLSALSKDKVDIAGGKGANLGEMYNAKFPVPPAFVVTTKAFFHFLKITGIEAQILEIIDSIDVDDTKQLDDKTEQIRKIIIDSKMPEDLQKNIIEAYDSFSESLDTYKSSPEVMKIMKSAREPIFVSVRSSATAEDLAGASFAGQQDSFINIKGNAEVIENVKKVFASIFTARSMYYRKKQGFKGLVGIAVVVQKMINSEKSGVMFTVDPVKRKNILIDAVFGQGEGIVSGRIKPDSYVVSEENFEILSESVVDKKIAIMRDASGVTKTIQLTNEKSNQKVLKISEIKQLAEYGKKLEKHYGKPQDIEFAIENDMIYIVQTRAITTLEKEHKMQELQGKLLTQGLGASPGVASGIVKIVKTMKDLEKVKKGDVLVTVMTNPDMVVSMQKASAIVTDEGGVTSHAAIVSREMGIPAVVGTNNATTVLEEGMEISVDGFHGKVFLGKAENKTVEILPIVETKTKIKVLVEIPEFAERAAKTKASGVGLVRLEGIIASHAKHPLYYEKNNTLEVYTKILRDGLEKISISFLNKEIWVRTSDIRSDEFANLEGAPKEIERNPMLGMHGIRFSLKHPEIMKAEFQALKDVADKGHKMGIMFPQVISVKEIEQAKVILKEMKMLNHPNIKLGAMIETPAACVVIDDICQTGIQFISFGTNDLTQFTLAIDRGNELVQYLYDETDWAVLKQISRVIRSCKRFKVESSICGQAGSNKKMVKFLVEQGIDSISVNADAAQEISKFVQKLEKQLEEQKAEGKNLTVDKSVEKEEA